MAHREVTSVLLFICLLVLCPSTSTSMFIMTSFECLMSLFLQGSANVGKSAFINALLSEFMLLIIYILFVELRATYFIMDLIILAFKFV